MHWYQWVSLSALAYCVLIFSYRFIRLLKMGAPKDLSDKSGNIRKALLYSYTTAMSPANKESAYLHLPTFTAGIFFHIGTFLSMLAFLWFIINSFLEIPTPAYIQYIVSILFGITGLNGLAIFLKRIAKKELREMSGFDDYASNGLTTLLQLLTAVLFWFPIAPAYYLVATALFLWMPSGKTKHLLYFFFARYHLGFFYGWRGTWPINKTV